MPKPSGDEAPIALLTFNLDGGGAERVMVTLANAFHRDGHAVDLLCMQARGVYLGEVDGGVRLVDLDARRSILAAPSLARYLRRRRPRALLSTMASVSLSAAAAMSLAAVPTRFVVRESTNPLAEEGTKTRGAAGALSMLRRWAYRRADRVIAPSHGVADALTHSIGLPAANISVIPNPLDIERIERRASEAAPLLDDVSAGAPVIVAVGRLSREKDLATLVTAFAALRARRAAVLLLLGEGDERTSLERLAASLGVAGSVLMPGWVDNPFSYLRRAAAYVLSSAFEGMPNTLLQALAVGTPVVATDCPSGPRELLEDGRWGRLVRVGDAAGMAAAIEDALDGRVAVAPPAVVAGRHGMMPVMRRYLEVLCG